MPLVFAPRLTLLKVRSVHLRWIAQAFRHHVVEAAQIFFLPDGEPAINLHDRKEPRSAHIHGWNRRFAAGILGHLPATGVSPAKHFTQVAAPESRFEVEIDLNAFSK